MWGVSRRQEVAWYISLLKRNARLGAAPPQWDARTPPSPGGGPGLLFSRGLLASVLPRLGECRPLALPGAMGGGVYTGGDKAVEDMQQSSSIIRVSDDQPLINEVPKKERESRQQGGTPRRGCVVTPTQHATLPHILL